MVSVSGREGMLSVTARRLTYVVAALYGVLGLVLFVAPGWAAANFPWEISPFVAMTMGGWYLGAAAYAFEGARVWRWSVGHPVLVFAWSFGMLEAVLLPLHRDVLRPAALLTIPYALVLLVASINAALGVFDWVRLRPAITPEGIPQPRWLRFVWVVFVVYVFALVVLLVDGIAPDGKFWPGPLMLITSQAFAAFFFSLVLGAIPLVFARGLAPVLTYMRAGFVAAAIILLAAFVFIRLFDFIGRPGGLIYIGSYVAAVVGAVLVWTYGRRRRHEAAVGAASG